MRLLIILFVLALTSCDKPQEIIPVDNNTPVQLLTQKDWKLVAAGFDDNRNGLVDDFENQLQDCQKDNSYIYHLNGTGVVNDNALSCGPAKIDFTWELLNNNKEIKLSGEKLFIRQLTKDSLKLVPQLPSMSVDFMMNYTHQ